MNSDRKNTQKWRNRQSASLRNILKIKLQKNTFLEWMQLRKKLQKTNEQLVNYLLNRQRDVTSSQTTQPHSCTRCEGSLRKENDKSLLLLSSLIDKRHVEDETERNKSQNIFICTSCHYYSHIYVEDQWKSVGDVLSNDTMINEKITKVGTSSDWLRVYLLVQRPDVRFMVDETEVHIQQPTLNDTCFILWHSCTAVGFYVVKSAGSCHSPNLLYSMDVLDMIYVSSEHRGHGLGIFMIQHFLSSYTKVQYVGFSSPLSISMEAALLKVLVLQEAWRDHVWLVRSAGDDGERSNMWLHLLNKRRQRQVIDTE